MPGPTFITINNTPITPWSGNVSAAGFSLLNLAGITGQGGVLVISSTKVGIGTGSPLVVLETFSASGGAPAGSGTSQPAASIRLSRGGGTNVLDGGSYTASPFGMWLQACNSAALGTAFPLILNPNGGAIGIGIVAPGAKLEVFGTGGSPATSGSAQNGIVRVSRGGGTNVLDCGSYAVSPFGLWLQACDSGNLATNYPLVLQPNGGNVGIGTASPTISGTGLLHVAGDTVRLVPTARTPANSAAAGNDGELCADSSFVYLHTGGSWRRAALSTF